MRPVSTQFVMIRPVPAITIHKIEPTIQLRTLMSRHSPCNRQHIRSLQHIPAMFPQEVNYCGMPQEDLARAAEISRSYLYELERGKYPANLDFIERISKVLVIEPHQLLERSRTRAQRTS
jgi:DNA-binding XRE family transcriptional regulator